MSREMAPPPSSFGKGQRGKPVVKPKDMKGTLRRLWELTQGQRKGLGWLLALSAASSASTILSPLLIGTAVTSIDTGNPALRLLILLAALYLTDWLVRFLQQFFMAAIGQRIILHIRSTLFEKMKALPLSFFDSRQHGELMSRLTNDVDNISTTISDSLTQLMTYGFTIIGILCIMLWLSPLLTCIAFLSVWLIFLLTRTITKHTRRLFASQQQILGKLNGQVEESISGLNMVKAFGREAEMTAQFEESNKRLCQVATKAQIWSGFLMPLTNVINNLNFVIVAVISGILAAYGRISVGLISSFLLYSRQFSRPFVDIANIYNNFQTAVAGAERIFEILEEEPEPVDAPDALPLAAPRGEVEFSHVTFGYQEKDPVLKDVSFRVPAGTRVAVVGSTGAGKTTLINLLTRFYDVNDGSILLDSRDLRQYRLQDLRRTFGVVLQDTSLFGMSVRDNISYGNKDVSPERILAAAQTAGADSFIRRLPRGYDTILTQGGAALSQGERQLLTIARAVLQEAPILILDEATSSVDTVTEQRIRRAMLTITRGRTSFIIAHRLSTIRDSDLILLIEDGRIAEKGTHEELMALNGRYAGMYRTQMGE
ncbi:ABC transporter ATP-binding protein [Eisenbergiella porci]|uniref:ABC transporter ATP-binding protein n=1 Tax=Eisenbergiella porci TaxID=2652274 RepID=UPI002A8322E3|nr:ABC transporter ATP-binding protein [Eisenbergiella porci]